MVDFGGRKALVTGGAAGLGLALSRLLHENGASVIACGRRQNVLEDAKHEMPGLEVFKCDLADEVERRSLTDFLHTDHHDLSIIIHNAAIMQQLDFIRDDIESIEIKRELEINLVAPMHLTASLNEILLKQPHANIVFVTSALARVPKKSTPVYCASKAGLSSFARTLSYQMAGTNVLVSEAIPALIKTAMTKGRKNEKLMSPEAVARQIVQGFGAGKREIRVGPVKILYPLHRFVPAIAYGMLKDQ